MFPWIRLMRAGLTVIGQPRVTALETTRVRLHVWPNDLDLNLHVNNGRYLALADIARMHWFLRSGVVAVARRERALPVVGDVIAKFRRDLKLFQKFEIQTRLLGWDHRWAFLEHRFMREGRVLGVVAIRGVFKSPNGTVDPQVFADALNPGIQSPPLPQWVIEWNGGCESLSGLLRAGEGRS
jgi:acyl-CoA thioesterase FadM